MCKLLALAFFALAVAGRRREKTREAAARVP
jgi:hypothetical protein